MRTFVGVVLSLVLLAAPCSADVIGSRSKRNAAPEKARIVRQMEQLGVHPEQARQTASDLTARDLEYFASNPGRVVLAGQETKSDGGFFAGEASIRWYELVGGLLFLGGVGAFIAYEAIEGRK